jgi:hypothetical protein
MRSNTVSSGPKHNKKEGEMVTGDSYDMKQDVITIRLTYLSRSAAFRQHIIDRLNADEDPFGMKDVDVGNVQVGIVNDDRDDFAAKLDDILGTGAGAEYVEEVDGIYATGAQDTSDNRDHIWGYWQDQADSNAALRPKKKQYDLDSLSEGSVYYTGEYTLEAGSTPDIEMIEGPEGPIMMFQNVPGVWFKLNP